MMSKRTMKDVECVACGAKFVDIPDNMGCNICRKCDETAQGTTIFDRNYLLLSIDEKGITYYDKITKKECLISKENVENRYITYKDLKRQTSMENVETAMQIVEDWIINS